MKKRQQLKKFVKKTIKTQKSPFTGIFFYVGLIRFFWVGFFMQTLILGYRYLCIHVSLDKSISVYIYPCIQVSLYPFILVYMYFCTHLSLKNSISVFIYPSIRLFLYPSFLLYMYLLYFCIHLSLDSGFSEFVSNYLQYLNYLYPIISNT